MIPIRDDAPRYQTPYVTYFLIALNILVFMFKLHLRSEGREQAFVEQFGLVPSREWQLWQSGPSGLAVSIFPMLCSMFIHASWLHLIANMWALWIFGDNIEDHLDRFRYLFFYLFVGIGGSVLHIAVNQLSQMPTLGASGAIAGIMGAYFVLFPAARVLTLVPFFLIWLPAWVMLGYWFVVQFMSGAATAIVNANNTQRGGVAVWAHVGGFILGVVLVKLAPSRPFRIAQR